MVHFQKLTKEILNTENDHDNQEVTTCYLIKLIRYNNMSAIYSNVDKALIILYILKMKDYFRSQLLDETFLRFYDI